MGFYSSASAAIVTVAAASVASSAVSAAASVAASSHSSLPSSPSAKRHLRSHPAILINSAALGALGFKMAATADGKLSVKCAASYITRPILRYGIGRTLWVSFVAAVVAATLQSVAASSSVASVPPAAVYLAASSSSSLSSAGPSKPSNLQNTRTFAYRGKL